MPDYILAIDQGTTSSRVVAIDLDGNSHASHQIALEQHYPANGWVEHDAEEIWQAVLTCLTTVIAAMAEVGQPLGIGITNQRETTVIWDAHDGTPAHRAIVWQDRRTALYCDTLRQQSGLEALIGETTGLLLDPYFSATKLKWLLDDPTGPGLRSRTDRLKFGTIESYLAFRLTNGRTHVTDATNASRTMLCDIRTANWSPDLLQALDIPQTLLPEIVDNSVIVGHVADGLPGAGLAIAGLAGDQQSAAIGQGCIAPGQIKSTYGTGCFLLLNTGTERVASRHKLLTTIAYQSKGTLSYATEGSIFNAGTVVQWCRDEMGLFENARDSEALATSVPDSGGVYMVPAFTGLGAPYWDADARGLITGLTRASTRAHIVRAGLESVIYQTQDLLDALKADGAAAPTGLRIDGGMAANNWFAQTLANISGTVVERPRSVETTALGAALCAAVGLGHFANLEAATANWRADARFEPKISDSARRSALTGWHKAVKQCLAYA